MKIMIKGGRGFIGSAVRELVSSTEHQVISVDRLTYASTVGCVAEVIDNPCYTIEQADICEPDRPGHDLRYAIDSSKISNELAWSPSRSFDQGLRETVAWCLANEWWWSPLLQQDATNRRGLAKSAMK